MDFQISAEIFLRLAKVALQPGETHYKYDTGLRSVRIEYRDGVGIAVATNSHCLVAECLPDCGENGEVNITIAQGLIDIAEAELAASGILVITQAPGWTVARGIETGKMYPLNAEIIGDWPDWRALVPGVLPSKNTGAFYLDSHQLKIMADASPSGVIVLPKFADRDAPIVIRDRDDDNWFGLIFLEDSGRVDFPKHAEIPEWIR